MTKIEIGGDDGRLNTSKLYGDKKPAVIFSNGKITLLPWNSIEVSDGKRYVVFSDTFIEGKTIYSSERLKDTLRDKSIALICNLSRAVSSTLKEYPGLIDFCGYIPLSSFYFTSDSDVILFSKQLSDIADGLMTDENRFLDRNVWNYGSKYEKAKPLCWLCSLVYYSFCGYSPFMSQEARETGKAIPLSVICQSKDPYTLFIDNSISMPIKKQYEIKDPFELFIQQTEKYISEGSKINSPVESDQLTKTINQNKKKAAIHSFFRKKGTIVFALSGASIAFVLFAVWLIMRLTAKPVTYNMTENDIVQFYYNAQNTLNAEEIDDPFARGTKCPALIQVTALYVSRQTRISYEGKDPVINAATWKQNGMGAIPEGSLVYGYTDISITDCPDGRIKVESLYYTSESEQELKPEVPTTEQKDSATIEEYKVTEYFTFTKKKGYLQITGVDTNIEYINSYTVPLIKESTAQRTDSIF